MNETTDTSAQPGQSGGSTGQPHDAAPVAARPPLRRSFDDRKIAGVAGGLGRYFGIDPLIFRVVFVTLAIFGGSGLLLYAVGWLLVPEDGDDESEVSRLVNGRATRKIVGGILLAIAGLLVVGNFAHTSLGFGGFAALVALAIAAYLYSRNDTDRPNLSSQPAPGSQPPPFYGPPGQGAYGQTTGTAYAASGPPPATAPTQPVGYPPPPPAPPYAGFAPSGPPPGRPPTSRPRSPLGLVTLSLALVTAGAMLSWNLATTHDVPAEVVLATCLAVVGIGLVVGAVAGRARWLIVVGAVLVVATAIAGVAHLGLRGGVGDRTWTPRTVAGLHDTYRLGMGEADLDLTQLSLAPGETVNLRVRIGLGDVTIVLPDGVPVDVDMDVNAGSIRLPFEAEQNGTSLHRRYIDPPDGSTPVITIDVELNLGSLEVRRASS